jgi:type II secretory pathway pseudopilin PulG
VTELNTDDKQFSPLGSQECLDQPQSGGAFSLVGLAILAGIVVILALILVPNFLRARARGQLTACKSNLKNLATALEMYASDNEGHYPHSLDMLTPKNYLKSIPTCPAAGKVTYQDYRCAIEPDRYSLSCCGKNHRTSPENFPQYSSEKGLIERY